VLKHKIISLEVFLMAGAYAVENVILMPHWSGWLIALLVIVIIWSAIWKAFALWKSARHYQVAWFVIFCIFNTAGILEILYLAFWQKDSNKPVMKEAAKKAAKK